MMPTTLTAIHAHAKAEFPRECCGLITINKGREQYRPCENLADDPDHHFILSPKDYAGAEEVGDIIAVVHSHPNRAPIPTHADLVCCELTGLPWVIVNWPVGTVYEFTPTGYEAPYVGRDFHHGVVDCFSIIKDWYMRELGILLPDFPRDDGWWLKGGNLYLENFAKAGFVKMGEVPLEVHDVILMQMASPVPNHGAIYVGDGRILHHPHGRLSGHDIYGGFWRKCTWTILRHVSLC
jgi:proteasome lid subunit RPN8/RPN11